MTPAGGGFADRVFVYGTLRRGGSNHRWLRGAPRLGAHRTAAQFTLLDLGPYPAAVAGGRTALRGEVYAVDAARLALLDRLEDCPREYRRQRIPTPFGAAWIYLYRRPAPGAPRIASGDWLGYRRQSRR
ncbi:MAG: gamma-glutamylcyclotransferase [Pseudomonadota bacterium]|nr:gamma-glutamylcyclotransferase [Pseudomonadota bacterium]